MPTSPESAVKKLSRLPSNCICANCGTVSKYGFSTICIKYLTFICNACKSSHQAISHRCKSLTMSSWDQGEVLKLKIHGNDYARKVWLGNAPPPGTGGRPKEGDDINVFKRFVVEAYEKKRYYKEPSAAGEGGEEAVVSSSYSSQRVDRAPSRHPAAPPKQTWPNLQQRRQQQQQHQPAPVAPVPAPVAPPPPVDLLDFGDFVNVAPTPPSQQPPPSAPNVLQAPSTSNIPAASAADPFFDPFNGNTQNANSNSFIGNPVAANGSANPSQNSNGNSVFGVPDNSGSSNSTPAFDPFGGSSISSTGGGSNSNKPKPSQKVVMKAPVMNNSGTMNGSMANSSHGNMMMNRGMSNGNSMMMNGGMNNGNSTMMNGGMMNSGNSMMMNGGMMSNNGMMNTGNSMMMNGGMMANNTMMNTGNGMMMNGGMGSTMNNNMMNMNGSMASSISGSGIQQQQPPPAMNKNIMQPMNNSISSNFGGRSSTTGGGSRNAAPVTTNKKSDPFAGLGF